MIQITLLLIAIGLVVYTEQDKLKALLTSVGLIGVVSMFIAMMVFLCS